MERLEVGKLLKPGVTKYAEATKFDFTDGGAVLYLFYATPSAKEIEAITKGDVRLGFYSRDNVLFMLFKFGSLNWVDAPYSAHLSKQLTDIQSPEPGQGYSLTIHLIDADTGIIKGLRLIGLPHKFSLQFKDAVWTQRLKQFDLKQHDETIANVYRNYTTEDLVRMADVQCRLK